MIIVLGTARARSERRDELVAAMHDMVGAARTDDGCLSYRFAADVGDPDVIIGIEMWRDQSALDAHMGHEHTAAFLAAVPELIDGEPHLEIHHVTAPA